MKKYKLKKWVSMSLYVSVLTLIMVSMAVIGKKFTSSEKENIRHVSEEVTEKPVVPVVAEEPSIPKPYNDNDVIVSKKYYEKNMTDEEKQNALIFYNNTYVENTGVLYTKNDKFDVLSVLEGKVTSVTKDDIMGNVVEITNSNNLITIYQCLDDVLVKEGDELNQNDVIGHSGKVNIDKGYSNALLFEVNYNGELINPENFYKMNASDLIK